MANRNPTAPAKAPSQVTVSPDAAAAAEMIALFRGLPDDARGRLLTAAHAEETRVSAKPTIDLFNGEIHPRLMDAINLIITIRKALDLADEHAEEHASLRIAIRMLCQLDDDLEAEFGRVQS